MKLSELPLNALRTFEALGRLGNIAAAAAELHVSPSAVSHSIKKLEEQLGTALCERTPRGLDLTDSGRLLLGSLHRGFGEIAQGVESLRAPRRSDIVTVSMLSTFALQWFIPRLREFQEKYPNITVQVATTTRLVDLIGAKLIVRSDSEVERGRTS